VARTVPWPGWSWTGPPPYPWRSPRPRPPTARAALARPLPPCPRLWARRSPTTSVTSTTSPRRVRSGTVSAVPGLARSRSSRWRRSPGAPPLVPRPRRPARYGVAAPLPPPAAAPISGVPCRAPPDHRHGTGWGRRLGGHRCPVHCLSPRARHCGRARVGWGAGPVRLGRGQHGHGRHDVVPRGAGHRRRRDHHPGPGRRARLRWRGGYVHDGHHLAHHRRWSRMVWRQCGLCGRRHQPRHSRRALVVRRAGHHHHSHPHQQPGHGRGLAFGGIAASSVGVGSTPATVGGLAWSGVQATAGAGTTNPAKVGGLAWSGVRASSTSQGSAPASVGGLSWSAIPAQIVGNATSPVYVGSLIWAGVRAQAFAADPNVTTRARAPSTRDPSSAPPTPPRRRAPSTPPRRPCRDRLGGQP
jgi:hypothetical protein